MVPPLFDEITNSVVSGFASAKMARTRTGESESSVLNVIFDESGLLYFVMVMGACVEPPWPMSTTVFSPWAMIESAKFWMSRRDRPSHVLLGARARFLREVVQARILGMDTAGNAVLHEGFRGRIQFFYITG